MNAQSKKIALVLSGGGARGAYEAGVIHYIRTQLSPEAQRRNFNFHCGASVGSINACFTAATAHDLAHQGQRIHDLWSNLEQDDIYTRDIGGVSELLTTSFRTVSSRIFPKMIKKAPPFRSFLDTSPLKNFLDREIPFDNIQQNIDKGLIDALVLAATNVGDGYTELFINKSKDIRYNGHYVHREETITAKHTMASAAIPVVFPSIEINGHHYIDGGLRLNTPLSPAVQLGSEGILAINLQSRRIRQDINADPANNRATFGQIVGRLLNTIFLDRVRYDLSQMQRINRIIEWSEQVYGKDYLQQINQHCKDNGIKGDVADYGLKKIEVVEISPSRDLGEIYKECFAEINALRKFTPRERFFGKLLGIEHNTGFDFLSYVTFFPEYSKLLLDLGFKDAKAKHDQLEKLMTG